MYRFKSSYIENLSAEERQHLLMSAIPMLPDFQTKAGNEGQIFYVSKDVIVKRYFSKIDKPEVLCGLFNKYCDECEEFWQKGYKIPRIYAWTMVSKPDHTGFDYYLLEEQVPGRELFFSNIMKMYEQEFKDHLSKDEFVTAVNNSEENSKLYEKILNSYVHDFLEMNERIESMPDAELERFLENIYKMFVECEYAIPDVHARNVLYHQGKLNLIDLYLEHDRDGYSAMKMTPAENLLLARIVALFNYNGELKKLKSNDSKLMYINDDIDFNGILCTEAMKKIIRAGKRLYKFNPNQKWWETFVKRIEKILDKEQTAEIIKEIDPKML